MSLHTYSGNNNHYFHHTDKCEWCSEYLKRGTGYCLNFTSKNSDLQFIITPFCSPKCYHESIEKGNTEKGNYERVVSDFIEDGSKEKWDNERKRNMEELKKIKENIEEMHIKNERNEKMAKWIVGIFIVVFIIYAITHPK